MTIVNFTNINFVANLVGLTSVNVETCPDCDELITADNPLVDETRYSTKHGSCIGCCDPTP
jgi:hypothetical protein